SDDDIDGPVEPPRSPEVITLDEDTVSPENAIENPSVENPPVENPPVENPPVETSTVIDYNHGIDSTNEDLSL
ncbi:unnamed protein product, partial [Allacma fusca]